MNSRTARLLAVLLSTLALCVAAPTGTAGAAGTGDVELIPTSPDGEARTSFRVTRGEDSIRFELVNLSDQPRTARLYAANAQRSEGGGIAVGQDGSAPWLQLAFTTVELAPNESREYTAPLDVTALPAGEEQLGAVVLEAQQGSVTVRVATLVTVEPRSALPLPTWAVALAVGAILVVLFGLLLARRRRGREEQVDDAVREPATVG